MCVTTTEAKAAATPLAQEGLREICNQILKIENDRDQRCQLLEKLKEKANPDTKRFLHLTQKREEEHIYFMNQILKRVDGYDWKNRHKHDWSKDKLFFLAGPCYYDGGLQTPEMKAFVDEELKRHYMHEPHHPEYELYNEAECSSQDILEMAIDRLSRNAQYGDGIIQLENMKRFVPKFAKGDSDAKGKLFWDYVVEYQPVVQQTFKDMTFDVIPPNWSLTSGDESIDRGRKTQTSLPLQTDDSDNNGKLSQYWDYVFKSFIRMMQKLKS